MCNNNVFPIFRKLYGMNGIPFFLLQKGIPMSYLYHSPIQINVEYFSKRKSKLYYDNHLMTTQHTTDSKLNQIPYKAHQIYLENTHFNFKINKHNKRIILKFNRPLFMILVKSNNCQATYLSLDKYFHIKLSLLDQIHINGYTIYKLSKYFPKNNEFYSHYLNCSQIHEIQMHFEINDVVCDSNDVNIVVVSSNLFMIQNSVVCTSYSN